MTARDISDYTIKRLYVADTMAADRYAVLVDGEQVAVIDWHQARRFMLGKLLPAELVGAGDHEQ